MLNEGVLQPDVNYTLFNWKADAAKLEHVRKLIWVTLFPFFSALYFCKFALLATYLQLFPPFMTVLRKMLYATIAYCVSGYIVSMALQLFLCWPIERNWSFFSDPSGLCSIQIMTTIFHVSWALHFSANLCILAMPFFILKGLQMKRSTVIGIYTTFALGLIDIAISLARFLTIQLEPTSSKSLTMIPVRMEPKRKGLHENHDYAPYAHLNKRRQIVREARTKLARHEYTVGWICAIVTEYVAGQTLLDEEHERHHDLPLHDAGHYTLGKIGPHNVVMAVLPEYGTSAATAVARDMLHSFPNVSIGLMVGIGGGAPTQNNDIRLGDIVVGTARNGQSSVVQYDFGKAVQGQRFQQTGLLNQPPWRLSTAVNGLQARHRKNGHQIEETISDILDEYPNLKSEYARPSLDIDNLYRSSVVHPSISEGPCAAVCGHDPAKLVERCARAGNKLVVHYGAIASANQVMKDALIRDKLAIENNFLCFEMEAAGLSNTLPCLVIRGICDYSDSHKNKAWQGYAAIAAAAYAKDLLYELSPLCSPSPAPTSTQSWNPEVAVDGERLIDERKQQLLESLTFNQIDARQMTIKRAHAKTCKWVLRSPQYLDWLDHTKRDTHHGFLWIKGKPGTGKSTLMKFVSTNYRKKMQQSTLITFFFNARGEQLEKSTVGMYRSLLFQLIESFPQLWTFLDFPALMTPTNGPREWTIDSLKDLFEEAVLNLENLSVTCFIDALDECDEKEIRDMVSFFEHLAEATTRKSVSFQVCFSSRHYPYITISKAVSLVLEGQQGHQDDIISYVSSELKIGDSKVAQQIRHDLQEKASGVFMWVVLVVDILNKEYDGGRMHRLRQRLREIPGDLNTLFRDILVRDRHHRSELLLCIQWVLFAKEPLRPEQLYFAILSGVEVDSTEALSDWDPEDITADIMKRFILDSSKGLTEVTKSKTPTVQFIHESVRDFLLKHDGLSQIWSEFGSNFSGQCHERLKCCCMNYINVATSMEIGKTLPHASSGEANTLREAAEKRLPFLRYATQQVLYHCDAAEEAGTSQLDFLQSFDFPGWITLDNLLEKHRIRRHTPNASLLYILAEQNRAKLISINRSKLDCFKVEDERYGAPILAALVTKSSDAVHAFLIAHKENNPNSLILKELKISNHQELPNLNKKEREFSFDAKKGVFIHAIELGGEMAVALLLELGEAGVDVADLRVTEAISHAVETGHLGICQFFLEIKQINIDQKDKNGLTPFFHAVKGGYDAIVRLLIETGRVDIDRKDKDGRKPLSFATSGEKSRNVVKILLDSAEADVNSRDASGRTPLSHAMRIDSDLDTVRLILDTGKVEVDLGDNEGRTPLSYAAASYSEGKNKIELLLATGKVEVDSRDGSGPTPLSYAASSISSTGQIKLLLDTGKVVVDSRDESGRTPLSYAAAAGRSENVSLLLDTGQANPSLEDKNGLTPLDYANRLHTAYDSEKSSIVRLLQSHFGTLHGNGK
ncbi:nacht and ankyrin domain protein [Colletotrichum camelliae]|nr:nacht and ankyrin domain protein [Colletotrichum camelliae]